MRSEIRRLLRETTSATSFWDDTDLLDMFNQVADLRANQMMAVDEGWFTDRLEADIVANQKEYTLPEGTDRVKRILLQFTEGGITRETPLIRHERWSESMATVSGTATTAGGTLPTYRLVGELIYLEPPPTVARTNGLVIESESLPARLTVDGSKLSLKFPSLCETLLIYDTWDVALGVEDAQGNVDGQVRGRLQRFHQKYEAAFLELITSRSNGRHFSTAFSLGD
jgi:hypothetical protein